MKPEPMFIDDVPGGRVNVLIDTNHLDVKLVLSRGNSMETVEFRMLKTKKEIVQVLNEAIQKLEAA